MLRTGLRRSIGNGMNTRTFEDPWLPRPPSFLPSSRPAYEVARVSDIIESPGKWNNEVVNQYFNVSDVECILSIPLSMGHHEILPTRNGLFRRNITSNTTCQLCGFGGESNAHAIFWCPVAQGIWNLMEFFFLHEVKEEINFNNVLLYASEVVEREAFAKFLICSWAIWTERNKITHGQ
ncbi:hypothetical protein F8388_002621 [Cannabis sativa]|uniref:Reverse transcriptase zinc-binding domain-containing protein n=1 Tax=Cannabis sativa TaxID=3483 RepID=A0A7J6FE24_CANSA|nr:hypothetical protein F8388_002621 [Cannabis sativa]